MDDCVNVLEGGTIYCEKLPQESSNDEQGADRKTSQRCDCEDQPPDA